ncbi:MAG: PSD1 domain-containing protein [Rubripirellula sp.]|nr:PSD1 domain-containing protein [Rubripirellula sp.]
MGQSIAHRSLLTICIFICGLFTEAHAQQTEPRAVEAGKNQVSEETSNQERVSSDRGLQSLGQNSIVFSEQVQPLLRRHCVRCHGENNQEADLRLDQIDRIVNRSAADPSVAAVIWAGKSSASTLIHRVTDPDKGDVMPLDSEPLSKMEILILRRWIDEGAVIDSPAAERALGEQHWAYQTIKRPEVPSSDKWESPIDRYVDEKLMKQGLSFSKTDDPGRLLRRVFLALTGLPPTPQQVQSFVSNPTLAHYESFVEECLHSPHYGQRWAVHWLDMARYADSNGFQADQIRDNWAYRDWVIRAFNKSIPYDQFITDQIAGDLVNDPTIDQQIATGFHRMTTCNVEAGVDPEANRVNQVVDRVNTTATVFLGSTLECAQCHDHKYDPFSQRDYYQLFAYFNNTSLEVKNTSDVTWDFYGPTIELPLDEATTTKRTQLIAELQEQQQQLTVRQHSNQTAYQEWVGDLRAYKGLKWHPVVPAAFSSTGSETIELQADGAVLLTGDVPDKVEYEFTFEALSQPVTAIRIDALTDDRIPGKGPGRGDAQRTNIILSEIECETISDQGNRRLQLQQPSADFSQAKWDVANAIDGDPKTGWAIAPQFGKPHWASFVLSEPLRLESGIEKLRITLKQLYGTGRVIGKPRISFYYGDPQLIDVEDELISIAGKEKPSKPEEKKLRNAFEERDAVTAAINKKITELNKQIDQLKPDTTLVMQEDSPRETFVMIRGDYETQGERVQTGIPQILLRSNQTDAADPSQLNEIEPIRGDRLDLANWLTSKQNPLTARVVVNQWWSEIFGRGLVSTPEDFGTQGERPTHPELLDWLASELMASGWSMKHLHKLMVMSHAFRQSSSINSTQLNQDPNNIWWSRSPRLRMKAEFIRDNALAISGLLSTKEAGPPIMPYQPENLWRSVGRNQPKWVAAENDDRFRRGVYVIWKRAAPYPSFVNFDAPNRGACTVQRSRSNTPIQALTLLNDPAYLEMALGLADRIVSESPSSDDDQRIAFGFQLALSRSPSNKEVEIVKSLLENERSKIQQQPLLAEDRIREPARVVQVRSTNRQELAAWLSVANTLLNLDETMTR